MLSNKKGEEQLYIYIFYMFVAIILLGSLIYFVTDLTKGRAIEKQLTAKKIALLLDSAQPGTKIILNSEKIELEQKDNKIFVKNKEETQSYEYIIYNPYLIQIKKEDSKIIIEVKDVE